jgi:hypothetical protein
VVLVQEAGGTTLFGNSRARRWSAWEAFLQRALAAPFGQDAAALRKLHINILAGNPDIVQRRAAHIRLRRQTLLSKARQQLRKVWRRRQPSPAAAPAAPSPTVPSQPARREP